MKVFKYSLIVLALAVVANVTLASADRRLGSNQTSVTGSIEIGAGKSVVTEPYIKEREATQYFTNVYTFTNFTDPCPKCDIVAQLRKRVNGKWDPVASSGNTRIGDKNDFSGNTAELTGIYSLSIKRNNLTAAATFVQFEWYVQPTAF